MVLRTRLVALAYPLSLAQKGSQKTMPHKFKLHRALILLWISLPLLDYAPGHAFAVAPTDTITTVYADINVTPLDLAVDGRTHSTLSITATTALLSTRA